MANTKFAMLRSISTWKMTLIMFIRWIMARLNLIWRPRQNIIFGGILASFILLLFLNSVRVTAVIITTIPLTIIGTLVFMSILGKSINVISLAGLAFAVGMVIDAAIIVLENIFRHKELGKNDYDASYIGTKEVWQAVFLSSLTTVLVFIPVLILKVEAGQLFRDISIAICCAITLSLILAVTMIPVISYKLKLLQKNDDKKNMADTKICIKNVTEPEGLNNFIFVFSYNIF